MTSLIYTNTRGNLSKKKRTARETLLKEQRAIKRELKQSVKNQPLNISLTGNQRSTSHIPSLCTGLGNGTKRAQHVYTGTEMIGIGQMHKSNAVPIFRKDDAVAIAGMRR